LSSDFTDFGLFHLMTKEKTIQSDVKDLFSENSILSNFIRIGKNWNGNTLADVMPQTPKAASDRHPKKSPCLLFRWT
jgi:hypothetical protein